MSETKLGMEKQWPAMKRLFWDSFLSSLHFAIASVNANGEPHVSPIGSLILREPGVGIFFEKFTTGLPRNLKTNNKVCVLAVNTGRLFWLRSLIAGRFASPPGVRMNGTVGEARKATDEEIRLFQRRVQIASLTKGHRLLWSDMTTVREIHFTSIEPLRLGRMSQIG